jgi:diguanylate cyclase
MPSSAHPCACARPCRARAPAPGGRARRAASAAGWRWPLWRWLPGLLLLLVLHSLWIAPAAAAAAQDGSQAAAPLQLDGATTGGSGWTAMRMLRPPGGSGPADAAAAWLRRADFTVPAGPHGNLGPHAGSTWLHLPVQLAAGAPSAWFLALDYALLHRVQVSVLDAQGRLRQTVELGALLPHQQRPLPTRALVAPLQLVPGELQHLMLRIDTPTGQLVEPLLLQPGALVDMENGSLAFLALMSGLWLFMLMFTVAALLTRRQAVFLAYAGSLVVSWLFTAGIYGTGAMWLWPDSGWLAAHITVVTPPLMVAANSQFFIRALQMRVHTPRTARLLDAISVVSLVMVLVFVAGLLGYAPVAAACMVLGVLHLAVVVPAALARCLGGDRSAGLVLLGCAANLVGIAGLGLLLRGLLPTGFVTVHLVQLTYASEMLCWLLALGLQLENERRTAAAAQLEREALKLLASTDPLTGLHNRRALDAALDRLLALPAAPARAGAAPAGEDPGLALFLLDLDGFKTVNDRWGHDAGDQLLREVAARLREVARPEDIVARLGGDEFVLVARLPLDGAPLARLGRRLMEAFERPFRLQDGRHCTVGATVGYALAPRHGRSAAELLRAADSAMYAGKQSGRHTLVAAA